MVPFDEDTLAEGKLPPELLHDLLKTLPTDHPQLLLGPHVGEDAAVIDFGGEQLVVAKSDPITFATDEIGYYAVNVCANDVAVTGATPRFYLPTLLLPAKDATRELAQTIYAQLAESCRRLNVVVAGGHSEVTATVNQPIVAGTMLGDANRSHFIATGGCQPGDQILLAGSIPIEGISIIAREKRPELLASNWSREQLDEAANYLYDPGISVLEPALAAARAGLVTAMHDPTEGGLATGLWELATAAKSGLMVDLDTIPIAQVGLDLCAEYGLDPLGTIASGALLATAKAESVESLLKAWRRIGWQGRVIGSILPDEDGIYAVRDGERTSLPHFDADEIVKLW